MRQKVNYVLIGTFVLVATALAVLGAILLGAGALRQDSLVLETYIKETVTGLDLGAHVRFRGVKIGEVTQIGFTPEAYEEAAEPFVLVRFSVDPRQAGGDLERLREIVNERLADGMRTRLASQGLTGALYLEADLYPDADEKYPPIEPSWTPLYPYVPSIPSTISTLSFSAERVLGNLAATDFPGLVEEMKETLETVDTLLVDSDVPGVARQIRDVLTSALETLEGVNKGVAGLNDEGSGLFARVRKTLDAVEPDSVRAIVEDVRTFSSRLDPTLSRLTSALAQIEGIVHGRGRDLDQILENVRRVAVSLGNLADTIEQHPSLLLFGEPPPKTRR